MPRRIRDIKYHPAADLTKTSIIFKAAYINVLQNAEKAIRRSNLSTSSKELSKTAHSCQIKLQNSLRRLRKEPDVVKTQKNLIRLLEVLVRLCASLYRLSSATSKLYSTTKKMATQLEKLPRMRHPSPIFFKFIQSVNDLLEFQEDMYQKSTDLRKFFARTHTILLKAANRHAPLIDPLNKLLSSLGTYLNEMVKFSKLMKPSKHLKTILKNANKLKYISRQYEKG